jgi:DNA-binding CsgD family transcriptional regulator
VDGSSVVRLALFIVPSLIGAVLCVVIAAALARKPSWLLSWFFCFYLLSVLNLALAFIVPLTLKAGAAASFRRSSEIGLAVCRLRYLFLVLFTHSLCEFRSTRALTIAMSALVGIGIALPFIVYSIVPNLMEILVVVYSFAYWLAAYALRERLELSRRREDLVKAVLLCSGFFLIALVLDLVEGIPLASAYVSVLAIDFQPAYVVCIGAVMTWWTLRDIRAPAARPGRGGPGDPDLSALAVSPREREVVALILSGETNAAIADRLFISESTVKKHVNSIFRKLGISSRWELVRLAGGILPKE